MQRRRTLSAPENTEACEKGPSVLHATGIKDAALKRTGDSHDVVPLKLSHVAIGIGRKLSGG